MEPALMMKTALALLTIAAFGGLVMALARLAYDRNPPNWLAMLHGLLAGAALTLLLYAHFTTGLPAMADWGLLVFLLAAGGGVFLNLGYQAKAQPLPLGIVLAHGGIAVIGYLMLLVAVLGLR
jgi:hypothetical protein